MKWILGAASGLIIAFFLYCVVGALSNLLVGPLLGYRIQKILFLGVAFSRENGKNKIEAAEIHLIPEVILEANVTQRWKKLILDIFPVVAGFGAAILISFVFGDVRGVYRHILIGVLSAMAILYCWHIFIVLKMLIYIKEDNVKNKTN